MKSDRIRAFRSGRIACVAVLLGASNVAGQADPMDGLTRSEIEASVAGLAAAFGASGSTPDDRRAYAEALFRLGQMWAARDLMVPLATEESTHAGDLTLGGKLAYLLGDYARAETLYRRLREVAEPDSEAHGDALRGLVLVYYQTDRYDEVDDIQLPDENRGIGNLLQFMKNFEGTPNRISWASEDRVARLPMINDYTQPGALPLFRLEVNGHPVEFILDTGGDRLYIDEGVAEAVGIRHVHQRQASYAYTGGETVDEPLGVAETVTMGDVTLENVPVVVAKWKVMGPTSDGVITTQMLKLFLSTVDYDEGEMVFRERGDRGREQLMRSLEGSPLKLPFWLSGTHLMYAKGSLNGREDLNMFMDSGLAASMPMIVVNETVTELGLDDEKVDVEGTDYYWVPLESHGVGPLTRGAAQALGNVFVAENPYTQAGFFMDVLVSHQYLRHFGSWSIDFDTFQYYFPADSEARAEADRTASVAVASTEEDFVLEDAEQYVGSYEVVPGVALEITARDGTVFLQAPGQQAIGMEAVGPDAFAISLANAQVTFERDETGNVVGLVLDQAGNQTRASRK